jgi:copper(I)-binding protein
MRSTLLVAGLLGLLAGWLALGPNSARTHVEIADPWVEEGRGPQAVLHVKITNTGVWGDRLLRISTRRAEKVSILDRQGKEGAGLWVPADSELVIGTGTPRIELIGLTKPLIANEALDLLFVFEQAGKMSVNVAVEKSPTRN